VPYRTQVEQRAGAAGCTSAREALASSRRPQLERAIALSNDKDLLGKLFEKLGIRVDDAGNIHDR